MSGRSLYPKWRGGATVTIDGVDEWFSRRVTACGLCGGSGFADYGGEG